MNNELEKRSFDDFSRKDGEKDTKIWKPEVDFRKNKFTSKEIVINIVLALSVIFGTIVMIAALIGGVVIIISVIKSFIRILFS